jgi:hypothetical protein
MVREKSSGDSRDAHDGVVTSDACADIERAASHGSYVRPAVGVGAVVLSGLVYAQFAAARRRA